MYLTCINCNVQFKDSFLHKDHYKSEWHRYNLKRKSSNLPPVLEDVFKQTLASVETGANVGLEDPQLECRICYKSFKSTSTYEDHKNSKKHKENEKLNLEKSNGNIITSKIMSLHDLTLNDNQTNFTETDMNDDMEDSTYDGILTCLFCNEKRKTLAKNLKHMALQHSFFIPDLEYCVDIEGLLTYLGEKIYKDFICLWCNYNGRQFNSLAAARRHMKDKCHCRISFDTGMPSEYIEFYDYSSSYPDHTDNIDIDEELEDENVLESDNCTLVLPSGTVITNRLYKDYFSQKHSTVSKVNKKSENKKYQSNVHR